MVEIQFFVSKLPNANCEKKPHMHSAARNLYREGGKFDGRGPLEMGAGNCQTIYIVAQ